MSNTSRLKKLTGQKDVKDIKAKADGLGNQKADGPRKMSKTSRLRPTVRESLKADGP